MSIAQVQPFTQAAGGDKEDPEKAEKRVGMTGLKNLGNTCFMNSTLQVLFNTPEIKDFFLRAPSLSEWLLTMGKE